MPMPEKSERILAAAEKLFARGRFHEVTLDDICHEAGVGKGTVYRYFEDKENLFFQVILSGLDELVASVGQVSQEESDPSEGLRQVARRIADFYRRRGSLFRLVHREQLGGVSHKKKIRHQWRRKTDKIVEITADMIAQGIERGRYGDTFSPKAAARLLIGMLRTGQRHHAEMPRGRDWPLAAVDLLEHGLGASPPGGAK